MQSGVGFRDVVMRREFPRASKEGYIIISVQLSPGVKSPI